MDSGPFLAPSGMPAVSAYTGDWETQQLFQVPWFPTRKNRLGTPITDCVLPPLSGCTRDTLASRQTQSPETSSNSTHLLSKRLWVRNLGTAEGDPCSESHKPVGQAESPSLFGC